MKHSNKSGFSLVALGATVTVMLILITTVVVSGVKTSNNAKKLAFATEINAIKESVDAYVIKNDGAYPIGDTVKVNISGVTPAVVDAQFRAAGDAPVGNEVILYQIDYNKLGMTSLKYGAGKEGSNDMYAVSTKTGRVYYVKGMKIGSTTYFTLTSDLEGLLSYNIDQDKTVENTAVVFEASTTDWTNGTVTLKAKIPKSYIVNSVTFAGGTVAKDTTATNNDANFQIYTVTVSGNGAMVVKYLSSSNSYERTERYDVMNIDKENPVVTYDPNNQVKLQTPDENVVGYIPISNVTDAISGMKYIKYENAPVTTNIKDYFVANGTEVKDNRIIIEKGVRSITLYAEDNAGNYYSTVITITIGQ